MVMGVERILASLCDALARENAEQSLGRALSILADSGIVIQEPGCAETWLSVESGGRSLSLALSIPPVRRPIERSSEASFASPWRGRWPKSS